MRLIDADALKESIEEQYKCDCAHDTDDDWSYGRASAWLNARAYVDNAPTIDAIPVEWIETHMTPAMAHFAPRAKELLLEAWQKEQEANDG